MKSIMKFVIFSTILNVQFAQQCNRKILESYGIISLVEPSKEKLVFCPNIKASCCPSYEQFKMFMLYQNEVKPHYIRLEELLKKELQLLGQIVTPLFKIGGDLENRVQNLSSVAIKRQAEDLFSRLQQQDFEGLINKALKYQKHALAYTASLKSTFFCSICDFDGQKFLNLEQSTATFSDDSCDSLVHSTILYSNLVNRGISAFLQDLSSLLAKLDPKNKTIILPGLGEVSAAINECAQEFKETEENLSSCRKYCSYYRLNSDLPVFEGYPEFFLNMLVQVKSNFGKPKPTRILAALISIDIERQDQQQLGFNRSKDRYSRMLKALQQLDDGRVLSSNAPFIDDLNPKALMSKTLKSDPFDEELATPDFDEHMMSEMLQIQNILSAGEPSDLKKIIKHHYAKSFEPEIEDLEDDNIFRVAAPEKVQLQRLTSKFAYDGIRFAQIIHEMDWSLQFHDIVLSLSNTARVSGNELIDKDLLAFLNRVHNSRVRDFHKDNFLHFEEGREFLLKDYHRRRREEEKLKKFKDKEKFEKANALLKEYNLSNIDAIIKELEQKRAEREGTKIEQAQQKLHELVKQEEAKGVGEKDFQENKEFLTSLIKQKGLKGVIEDLKKNNAQAKPQVTLKKAEQIPEKPITTIEPIKETPKPAETKPSQASP